MNSTGTQDTLAGDVVPILVSPDGPYGVQFIPDTDGHAAVVKSFDRLPDGKFGPIQKHGGVHVGDVLFEIGDSNVQNTKFNDVVRMINDRNILKKTFKFVNSTEYYRRK